MGKASRKKKQSKPDPAKLHADGLCTRCAKRPFKPGSVWCSKCHADGRRKRDSRPPRRLPKHEQLAVLDEMIGELS